MQICSLFVFLGIVSLIRIFAVLGQVVAFKDELDADLVKLLAAESATGVLAGAPLVATGAAIWLAAVGAAAVLGAGSVAHSTMRRSAHEVSIRRVFVDLKEGRYGKSDC
jgi:hypothetical protein